MERKQIVLHPLKLGLQIPTGLYEGTGLCLAKVLTNVVYVEPKSILYSTMWRLGMVEFVGNNFIDGGIWYCAPVGSRWSEYIQEPWIAVLSAPRIGVSVDGLASIRSAVFVIAGTPVERPEPRESFRIELELRGGFFHALDVLEGKIFYRLDAPEEIEDTCDAILQDYMNACGRSFEANRPLWQKLEPAMDEIVELSKSASPSVATITRNILCKWREVFGRS